MRKLLIITIIFIQLLCVTTYAKTSTDNKAKVKTFYAYDYVSNSIYQVDAELRKEGKHCYVYVERKISNEVIDNEIQYLVEQFDNTIWPNETNFFGSPPDVDNNEKIYILILDIPSSEKILGYFLKNQENGYDKIEILYLDYRSSTDEHVLAHEFNHMIHYNYDKDEESWISEGLATFAEFYVYPAETPKQIDEFLSHPNTTLVETSPSNFGVPNYGASFLFMLYLRDHFGEDIIRDIFRDPDNGIDSLNKHLPLDFEIVFKNWVLANYLNSFPGIDQIYSYTSISSIKVNTQEITCNPLGGTVIMNNLAPLNKWAATYIKVKLEENNFLLTSTFRGNNLSNFFSASFYENILTWFDLSSPFKMTNSIQTKIGKENEIVYIIGRKNDYFGTGKYEIELSAPFVDAVLVIDRSGSMRGSRIAAAKEAAKMFVGLMNPNDKVGVVSFSSWASLNYPLTRIDADGYVKSVVKGAIDRIYASGMTSIGAGLRLGHSELQTKGKDDPVWAMILLSDGWENTRPYVREILPSIVLSKTKVYTIGLGSGADESLLNTIALVTGGFYRFSPSVGELTAIYQDIRRALSGFQGLFSQIANITQGAIKAFEVNIDSTIIKAIFTAAIQGSDIDLRLIAPDGTVIDPATASNNQNINCVSGDTYESCTVVSPMPGKWHLEVIGVDVAPGGETISVSVSGDTELKLNVDFDKIEYLSNEPILVLATLKNSDSPVLGASVVANVRSPAVNQTLILYDDGLHNDGVPNDGIYANSYTNTSLRGSYTFEVIASGTLNNGEVFNRTITKSTVVGRDSDNDGMPDIWEDIYGLDKYRNDAAEDSDDDGLSNLEEYKHKTNPKNYDTDGDGYSDGEEIQSGSDPLDPNSIPHILGDLDGDGDVDRNDLSILLSYKNQSASVCPNCDINGDGIINILDMRQLVTLCTRLGCATESNSF